MTLGGIRIIQNFPNERICMRTLKRWLETCGIYVLMGACCILASIAGEPQAPDDYSGS